MKRPGPFINYVLIILILISLSLQSCLPKQDDEEIPIVSTDDVTDISEILAVFKGTLVSTGKSVWVDRGVCYSNIIQEPDLTGEYFWADGGSHIGSFSVIMEDLTPGTKYYVRAYALNSAGNAYGGALEFTTSGSVTGNIEFNPGLSYGEVSDTDGNTYKTIIIGDQNWMAENLRTTKYNDGTDIPLVSGTSEWINMSSPGYCWYLNDEEKYKNIYGALYNWHAVNTGNLCPDGWHVPDDSEWAALAAFTGGESVAGNYLKEADLTHWIMTKSSITNSSGFTALPGGTRWGVVTEPVKYYSDMGYSGYFWSATGFVETDTGFNGAYSRTAISNSDTFEQSSFTKSQGLSVRCIQD